ncbi:hypothetical protein ACFFLZ_16140 [Photobacterium aphoticum]|uniref:Uncharacterized protein n=2 Tax=Photobacterium aphoticum TaxID=754436 RepID=A0A0J1GJS6_9GAMM|nr:hypothetical protein [Photobacterium aphoticum]KLU99997.1 hypothetical protein ABT58_13445 [Photobacterium aphoticum]PSU58575.1 hypothetical protein C9I90_06395 [Photobacterium aphoticum]
MSNVNRVQHININRFEIKSADTDDPVSKRISWNPLALGGCKYKAQTMTVLGDTIEIKESTSSKLMLAVFWITGLVLCYFASQSDFEGWWITMFIGVVFTVVGLAATFLFFETLTFDKAQGVYFRGQYEPEKTFVNRQKQGRLADIYALQILSEHLHSGVSPFISYELNLVFENGERLNVMDHGDLSALEDSAMRLAELIHVPIWKAY